MIVDLILDRKDGTCYDPREFYRRTMDYGKVGSGITQSMDGGTEKDVKREIKKYLKTNGYSADIGDWADTVNWLGDTQ